MKVRGAGRETAEDRSLDLADVIEPAINQRLPEIRCNFSLARGLVSNDDLRQVAYVKAS